MAQNNKRRKAVVDARIQWTLAGRVVMHFFAFICGGVFLGLIFQYLSNPLGGLSEHFTAFWKQSAPMLMAMLCLIPIFVRDTLTLSNRIAGPIYRLRSTIKRIGDGETAPPLSFRKNDMWDHLPDLFNKMTDQLGYSPCPPRDTTPQDTADSARTSGNRRELVEV